MEATVIIAVVAGLLTMSWRYLIRRRGDAAIIDNHPPARPAEQGGTGPLTAAPNEGEASADHDVVRPLIRSAVNH